MSLESVKTHFTQWNGENDVTEFETSSATVEQAAETIGVSLSRIAKSLSFRGEGDQVILIVTAGDAKIDNKTYRQHLALKQECSLLMRYWSRQAMKLEEFAQLDWLMILRFILMYR
ncbi:RNA-binding protein [Bacillus subtilis]|nr:hypothetical protein NRS6120_00253 [Bacillus subtilis]CAI6324064.1 RNA-binding protein [Bacillus subtilis]